MINIKYIKNIISQALNKVEIFYGNISAKAVIDYFSEYKKERKDITVIIELKIYTIFYLKNILKNVKIINRVSPLYKSL